MTPPMSTNEELREHFANLSDEELLRLLRAQVLTETASAVAREELAGRGTDAAPALALPVPPPPTHFSLPRHALKRVGAASRRMLRFPWRAILGVEPLWTVIVFGALGVLIAFDVLLHALVRLLMMRPLPPHALLLGYAGLAVHALSVGWWGVALWRTAGRNRSSVWSVFARVLAALCAIQVVTGPISGAKSLKEYLPAPESSVMDLPSRK